MALFSLPLTNKECQKLTRKKLAKWAWENEYFWMKESDVIAGEEDVAWYSIKN